MEELENKISTQVEENTVSLASAQALADALAKIEVYTPTTWVDNSSPDIDAEHLNKPEQAIKRVTDALNSAVDVIKDLQSQVTKNAGDISTVNNNLGNYKKIIVSDTPADDLPSLLKAKAKLIANQNAGEGFYVIIGGWQGRTYGFTVGNVTGGKITIACFVNSNCYLATCDYSNPENNFSYTIIKPDLSSYITKAQLFTAQSQSFLVNKNTTIDGTLFSTANFKAQRPTNGTGAASYGFENIGINSGALYLDPTDYKLHFINYEGKDFTINWTQNN